MVEKLYRILANKWAQLLVFILFLGVVEQVFFKSISGLSIALGFLIWLYIRMELYLNKLLAKNKENTPKGFWANIKSWLFRTFIALPLSILGLALAFVLLILSAPASIFLLFVWLVKRALRKYEGYWANFIRSIIKPLIPALVILSIILAYLNFEAAFATSESFRRVELIIIALHDSLFKVLILDLKELVIILGLLVGFAYLLPNLDLLKSYQKVMGYGWYVLKIVAILSTFSFLSGAMVIDPHYKDITSRFELKLNKLEQEERIALAEIAVLIDIEEQVLELDETDRILHANLITAVYELQKLSQKGLNELSKKVAARLFNNSDNYFNDMYKSTVEQVKNSLNPRSSKLGTSDSKGERSVGIKQRVDRQILRLERVESFRSELKVAVTDLTTNVLFGANNELREMVSSYLNGVLDANKGVYKDLIGFVVGKEINKRIFKLARQSAEITDNVLFNQTFSVKNKIFKPSLDTAKVFVGETLTFLRSDLPNKLAKESHRILDKLGESNSKKATIDNNLQSADVRMAEKLYEKAKDYSETFYLEEPITGRNIDNFGKPIIPIGRNQQIDKLKVRIESVRTKRAGAAVTAILKRIL